MQYIPSFLSPWHPSFPLAVGLTRYMLSMLLGHGGPDSSDFCHSELALPPSSHLLTATPNPPLPLPYKCLGLWMTPTHSLTHTAEAPSRSPVDSGSLDGDHFSKRWTDGSGCIVHRKVNARNWRGLLGGRLQSKFDSLYFSSVFKNRIKGKKQCLNVFVLKWTSYHHLWLCGIAHNLVPRLVISLAGTCKKYIHPHMYIWDMLEKDSEQTLLVGVMFMWVYIMAQMAPK